MPNLTKSVCFFALCLLGTTSHAESFDIEVSVNNQVIAHKTSGTIFQAQYYLDQANIDKLYEAYSGAEVLDVRIQYSQFNMHYQYPQANLTTLEVDIPAIGFHQSFTGKSREESKTLAFQALKDGGYLQRLQKTVVRETVSQDGSVVAGSPLSLLANTVRSDLDQYQWGGGGTDKAETTYTGLRYAWQDNGGGAVRQRGLFLHHRYRWPDSPWEVGASLPLLQIETPSSESYAVIAGAYIKREMTSAWQLGLGLTESAIYTRQSEKTARYEGYHLFQSIHGNIGAYNWAWTLLLGDYQTRSVNGYDPQLSHGVIKQRVTLTHPWEGFGQNWVTHYFVGHTRYNGSAMQQDHAEELGFSLTPVGRFPWSLGMSSELGQHPALFISLGVGF